MERFWAKVDKAGPTPDDRPELGPCWLWTATQTRGYGRFHFQGRLDVAHRVAYEIAIGQIPDGKVLDHLCRTPSCVNPSHLEVVSQLVNVLRGVGFPAQHAKKTHCPQGHPYDEENTYRRHGDWRECRVCKKARKEAWKARHRQIGAGSC
jgi:hypothetical protein